MLDISPGNRDWDTFTGAVARAVGIGFSTVFLVSVFSAGRLSAETGGNADEPFPVPKASSAVTIDGVIDEQAWKDALSLELRYEVSPGENIEPPVRTELFITYDERRVLVAFRAYDPEPEEIRARFRDRDHVRGDDHVGVTFDTFNDERRAYEFMVNPLGVQTDGIYNDVNRKFDRAWDGIWYSAGRLTDFGYEVEMAIPFNQIRFQATNGPQIWGIDATRSFPRTDRHHIGLFPRERGANSYLAQEEKIVGFEGVSRGRNIELVPTLTGYALEERPDFPDSLAIEEGQDLELGATVTWGITPNITFSGAINPDFSQIEADAVQLALNQRFTLFFEEKRPFFLESSDYLETGLELLYTRMIADPLGALKLTGKIGRHTIGVFSARDEVTNLIVPGVQGSDSATFDSSNTSTVGRYRYDLGSDSTIGAMLTDRAGSDGYFNRVASIDARLRPTEADSFSIDAAWSDTRYSSEMQLELDLPSEEISGHALKLEYVHTKRSWFAFAEYRDFGDDFRADLGFIPRVGYRGGNTGFGYLWWGEEKDWYNRLEVGGFLAHNQDQGGELLDQMAQVWFQGEGPYQSDFHLELGNRTEVYEGVRFENLFVPFLRFRIRPSASFSFRVVAVTGDWIDFSNVRPADRLHFRSFLDFDIGRHLELELSHTYSALDVDGGQLFQANVPQAKAVWQFNTRTFVRGILQYTDIRRNSELYEDEVDDLSKDFFVQLLFSYKVNPRTVFFAGYSEGGAQDQDISMTTTNRSVFIKLGYAWLW